MPYLSEQRCRDLAIFIYHNRQLGSVRYLTDLFVGLRQAEYGLGHSLVREYELHGNLDNAHAHAKTINNRWPKTAFSAMSVYLANNPLPDGRIPPDFHYGFWPEVEALV